MRVCVTLSKSRISNWHLWLIRSIKDAGHEVEIFYSHQTASWPRSVELLILLEGLAVGLPGGQAIAKADNRDLSAYEEVDELSENSFDVLINLSAVFESFPHAKRTLTPIYDGRISELGAWDAATDGRALHVDILEGRVGGSYVISGTVALINRHSLSLSLNNSVSRVADMLLKALELTDREVDDTRHADRELHLTLNQSMATSQIMWPLLNRVQSKIARLLNETIKGKRRRKWTIGYRILQGAHQIIGQTEGTATYTLLPDDGNRFFADPFTIMQNGKIFIFVEEYPAATSRGLISVIEMDMLGNIIKDARPVLCEPFHLSYPFVFKHAGQIWMLPEASESGRLTLYRAEDFPSKWVPEAELLSGVSAFDATLHQDSTGFWLFVTLGRWQSSTWDSLSVFHARDLMGPWVAHDVNPVVFDSRTSRSAGKLLRRKGQWYRLAQCARTAYGEAISVCRLDRLDRADFAQTTVGEISAVQDGFALATHTYNIEGSIEFVDFFGELDGRETASLIWTGDTLAGC